MARKVTITFTGAAPLDAHKAAAGLVFDNERKFELKGAFNAATNKYGVKDVTAKEEIAVGADPNQLHVYTSTRVMATGVYTFAYKNTYANAEEKKKADAVVTP